MTTDPRSGAYPPDDRPERFDLIIIGSGSGNAIPEYLSDRKIAIVERGTFGGTCLNVGCIPSKMFVLPADMAIESQDAARLGLDIEYRGADWAAIRDRVFGRIDPIAEGGRAYRANGMPNIELIEGTARFVARKVVDVEGRRITADDIVVAAGSRPTVPPIPGLVETGFHTSDSIMRLERFPDRLGIIGGGYIAVEMGHVFAGLGARVSVFNRSEVLLRAHDREIAERFTEVFSTRIDVHLNHLPTKIERRGAEIVVHCDGAEIVVDELLVATGREPNSDLLDVEEGGLTCHHHGTIVVDEHMRTAVDGVWAIGDIANRLPAQARRQPRGTGRVLEHRPSGRSARRRLPRGALGRVQQSPGRRSRAHRGGGSRPRSRRGHRSAGLRRHRVRLALVDDTSFAKVIVDAGNRSIVGAHIIGPQAATLIQPLIQAMQFGQTADELAHEPYWIHPALTEVVENALLEALEQL